MAIQDKIVLYLKSIWLAKQQLCGRYFTDTRNDGQRQNFPPLIGGDVALRQRGLITRASQ